MRRERLMIDPDPLPKEHRPRTDTPRLLLLMPWLTCGGVDKFNLDLLQQLTRRGWQVTVATTLQGDHSWLPYFARFTSDIVVLHQVAPLVDYPRFLRDLIGSPQVDGVIVAN